MDDSTIPAVAGVKRVIYREILPGDRRKFDAASNDATSGGGARDLRFSPYSEFESEFKMLFPREAEQLRKREGERDTLSIFQGDFYWLDGSTVRRADASFEPPTDARPTEGRIPQINSYDCFRPIPETADRLFLLLIQRADDTVWPAFATEGSLRSGQWNARVADKILACVQAPRNAGVAVAGYIDFTTGKSYCNERSK